MGEIGRMGDKMKRLAYLLIVGTVFFLACGSNSFANDPPHNLPSSVDCNDCHGEALQVSDPGDSDALKNTYNQICLDCHLFIHLFTSFWIIIIISDIFYTGYLMFDKFIFTQFII